MRDIYIRSEYKILNFNRVISLFLVFEFLQLAAAFSPFFFIFPLLFPVFLYFMYATARNPEIQLFRYWPLLIPVFHLLLISLFLVSPAKMTPEKITWFHSSILIYALYLLIPLLAAAHYLRQHREVYTMNKSLLTINVGFLYLLYALVLLVQVFFSNSSFITDWRQSVTSPFWLFREIIILTGIVLKLLYLLRNQGKPDSSNKLSIEELSLCQQKLKFFFEEREIFKRRDLDEEMVSQRLQIPIERLNYYWKEYLKIDFNLYVAKYRIDYAIALMEHNDKNIPLSAIADECGFKNRLDFSKYFLQLTGQRPEIFTYPQNAGIKKKENLRLKR